MDRTVETRLYTTTLFNTLSTKGLGQHLLDNLADNVKWIATGSSPLSGITKSKHAYKTQVSEKLQAKLDPDPVFPIVDRILADGDWATVLFHTRGVQTVSGMDFGMHHCWVMRVDRARVQEMWSFDDQKKVWDLFAEEA